MKLSRRLRRFHSEAPYDVSLEEKVTVCVSYVLFSIT